MAAIELMADAENTAGGNAATDFWVTPLIALSESALLIPDARMLWALPFITSPITACCWLRVAVLIAVDIALTALEAISPMAEPTALAATPLEERPPAAPTQIDDTALVSAICVGVIPATPKPWMAPDATAPAALPSPVLLTPASFKAETEAVATCFAIAAISPIATPVAVKAPIAPLAAPVVAFKTLASDIAKVLRLDTEDLATALAATAVSVIPANFRLETTPAVAAPTMAPIWSRGRPLLGKLSTAPEATAAAAFDAPVPLTLLPKASTAPEVRARTALTAASPPRPPVFSALTPLPIIPFCNTSTSSDWRLLTRPPSDEKVLPMTTLAMAVRRLRSDKPVALSDKVLTAPWIIGPVVYIIGCVD